MSIYGITNSSITRAPLQSPIRDNPQTERTRIAPQPVHTPQPSEIARQAPAGRPAKGLPVEPPAGTDPALWSVLSSDERVYFAKVGAMGPLTYGRKMAEANTQQQMPASRGGRLDIKV